MATSAATWSSKARRPDGVADEAELGPVGGGEPIAVVRRFAAAGQPLSQLADMPWRWCRGGAR
jgi:hypothetical protein